MIKEYFKIAIKNLKTRQLRSWLTILGIVIGIFLIMSLLSLSEGLKQTVLKHLNTIGKDILMIIPGDINDMMTTMLGGMKLTDDELKAIEKSEGVEAVVPMLYKGELMKYQGESKNIIIYGVDIKKSLKILQEDLGFSLSEGSWPVVGKREIAVGSLVPKDIFPELRIGTQAKIGGIQFEIVGILKSRGSKQDDSLIFMGLDLYEQITGEKKGAPEAVAKVKNGFSPIEVAKNIENNLLEVSRRKVGDTEPSFSVLTNEEVSAIVGNVMGVIQVAVVGFASIAIIVGGIGIMNTMYTSVHERTREIGILKAVGAKNSIITTIFLIESGIIGLIGGMGGVVLGLGLSKLIEFSTRNSSIYFLKSSISFSLVIFGLAFSFLVGCLSGFLPARGASKLKPVDALRYE
jgi:putative ABC transport system permease protein